MCVCVGLVPESLEEKHTFLNIMFPATIGFWRNKLQTSPIGFDKIGLDTGLHCQYLRC